MSAPKVWRVGWYVFQGHGYVEGATRAEALAALDKGKEFGFDEAEADYAYPELDPEPLSEDESCDILQMAEKCESCPKHESCEGYAEEVEELKRQEQAELPTEVEREEVEE